MYPRVTAGRNFHDMSDLQLPQASASRPGAQGIGAEGFVIGRIFRATTSPVDRMWMLAYGYEIVRIRADARGRCAGIRQELAQTDLMRPADKKKPASPAKLRPWRAFLMRSRNHLLGSFTPQTRSRPRLPPSRNLRSARISGAGSWCANRTRACTHESPSRVRFRADRTSSRHRRMTESDPERTPWRRSISNHFTRLVLSRP
jgi:hypothetical protein